MPFIDDSAMQNGVEFIWWMYVLFTHLAIAAVCGTVVWQFRAAAAQKRKLEDQVAERTHVLGERVKELKCLNDIFSLITTPGISLDDILQSTVNLIPPSCQHPEIISARIEMEDRVFTTENFAESPWQIAVDIFVHGDRSGIIELFYLEKLPSLDDGPFLQEERNLLKVIAVQLGQAAEQMLAESKVRFMVALEERERIGRELHDDLGQVMGYISVQAQTALQRLENREVDEAYSILAQLRDVARNAFADVRKYILGIRTTKYNPQEDFFAELYQLLDTQKQYSGLVIQVSRPDDWKDIPIAPEVETQLLRIIQEAVTNIRKHAGVASARLTFTETTDEVQVIIADDGRGFDPQQAQNTTADHEPELKSKRHFGLAIMRERAAAASGRLEIRSSPEEGTRVIVCLPRAISKTMKSSSEVVSGVRVLLVDDHPLFLEGLHNLLAARGMQVVGQAHDGLEGQRLARDLHPDLILMDVHMPRCDGLEATRIIKAEFPEVKIVMLTVAADEKILYEALKSGASGYLLKSLDRTQFFALLGKALEDEIVFSPGLAARVLSEMAGNETSRIPQVAEEPLLTARQQEVFEQLAAGKTNKEIAAILFISESTVKYHVSQVLERLQLKSRYELVIMSSTKATFPKKTHSLHNAR